MGRFWAIRWLERSTLFGSKRSETTLSMVMGWRQSLAAHISAEASMSARPLWGMAAGREWVVQVSFGSVSDGGR